MGEAIDSVDYDLGWPAEFARLRDRVQAALGDVAVAIRRRDNRPGYTDAKTDFVTAMSQ